MAVLKTLLLSTLLAAACAAAQAAAPGATPAAPAVASTASASAPVPLLWKVSDRDNSLYLLGSFHLLKPDDYPLSKDIDAAFADAESVLFELDPATLTAPDTIAKYQKAAAYADGKTLTQVLPAATREKLDRMLAVTGQSAAVMDGVEPWAVSVGLVMGISQALGFKPEQGLDRHLMDRAAKAKKPAAGLETVDVQIAALDGAPHAEQIAGLDEFLADPKKSIGELQSMHAWWRAGDVAKLDGTLRAEMARKTPVSYRMVNTDRNKAWLPKLEARLKDGKDDTLVVVGALHLLGSDGVVEQLRARGYTVERVCSACGPAPKR